MKINYQIRTGDFEYIMVEKDIETHEEAVQAFDDLKHTFNGSKQPVGEGLDPKTWNIALDGYMELKTLPSELYEKMNKEQQGVLQELKKHYKRLNYKTNGKI